MSIDFTVFKGSPHDGIVEATSHRALPTGNEVLVKITHSGICGTDEHYKHAEMALGHEGVGTVEQVGERVKGLKVGDVVGWGYLHKTCGACPLCLAGHDNYCTAAEMYGTANFDQGSFGTHAIWDASWLFKIPAGLAPEDAAPLMCGGAAVFGVIYNIHPTDRVGVVGVGGLGHLAIQFLAKMGARAVVFSSTEAKRAEALQLGAAEFYVTKGVEALDIGTPLDHLLVTTNSLPDWSLGTDVVIPALPLAMRGLTVQGSGVASRGVYAKMLDFAAAHKIKPIIEHFPMTKEGVEEGMAKLREGRVRYKAVLVV